ncbi:MAG TPA: DUF5715 family protein [Gemmatimonadaceae bacterium]|nr:DUF5715 family protein [Gemmatimonadaceae bacterium]
MRHIRVLIPAIVGLVSASGAVAAQSLRGSPSSVDLMYSDAQSHELAFLKTPDDVYQAAMAGGLMLITINDDLTLDDVTFPFVLPNTLAFADSLAHEYHQACGERLTVTSGARPTDEQPPNASPKSVHPTGMAVDFHKPSNPVCLKWLRTNLLALEDKHVIEATEEHHPAHFHVAVLKQSPEPSTVLAAIRRGPATTSESGGEVASGSPASTATYKVRAGDNLWNIARVHNTTVERIKQLNGLSSSRLRVGTVLKLR